MTADELFCQVERLLGELDLDLLPGDLTLRENMHDTSMKLMKNIIFKINPSHSDRLFIRKLPGVELPQNYKTDSLKSMPLYYRVWIVPDKDISDLKNYLLELYIRSLPDEAVFGCCNEFNQCSDNMNCMKDLKFSIRCMYKKNLDEGRIFYGKNRNI